MRVDQATIFGGGTGEAGSDRYDLAAEIGAMLATMGCREIVTGGYGGTMEAPFAGAASVSVHPPATTAVVVESLWPDKAANAYASKIVRAQGLPERLAYLIGRSDVYIALYGNIGTLAEILIVLNMSIAGKPQRLFVHQTWFSILSFLKDEIPFKYGYFDHIRFFRTVEELEQRILLAV
jgi:uncharacterized protein (TIGR00725 family)